MKQSAISAETIWRSIGLHFSPCPYSLLSTTPLSIVPYVSFSNAGKRKNEQSIDAA